MCCIVMVTTDSLYFNGWINTGNIIKIFTFIKFIRRLFLVNETVLFGYYIFNYIDLDYQR